MLFAQLFVFSFSCTAPHMLGSSLHDPSQSELAIKHTTHMVHDCIRRLPSSPLHIDSFVTVFDLSGYGMANR